MIHNLDMTQLFVWGVLLHFIADWMLQNEWMALNKMKRRQVWNGDLGGVGEYRFKDGQWWNRHPAAYLHSFIHFAIQCWIFPLWAAVIIGVFHLIIDTRTPLVWWGNLIQQTQEGPIAVHVSIWRDQIAHMLIIAIAAGLVVI
jgi:hypothetical protein